jgi:hypothetical protein
MFDLARGTLFLFGWDKVLSATIIGLIIFVFIFQSLVTIILSYMLMLKNLLFSWEIFLLESNALLD